MLDVLTKDTGSILMPDFMLTLDSRDITGNISNRLINLTLTDNRGFEADPTSLILSLMTPTDGLSCRYAVLF